MKAFSALVLGMSLAAWADSASVFSPGLPAESAPDNYVRDIAPLPDGRFLLAGSFTNLGTTRAPFLARLLPNGLVDPTFQHGLTAFPRRIELGTDGAILLSSYYTNDAQSRPGVARLLADGASDPSFTVPSFFPTNATLGSLLPAPEGKMYFSGAFTNVAGLQTTRLARLLPDGSPDATFLSTLSATDTVSAIVPLPSGALLLSGVFAAPNQNSSLLRLTTSGAIDPAFQPEIQAGDKISRLALGPEGEIYGLLTPAKDAANPFAKPRVIRLTADGRLDPSFAPEFTYTSASSSGILGIQPTRDGKLIVLGYFMGANGLPAPGLIRLHHNGSTDFCWDPGDGFDSILTCFALLNDQTLLAGGAFRLAGPVVSPYLAQLHLDTPCDPAAFAFAGSEVVTCADSPKTLIPILRRGGLDLTQQVDLAIIAHGPGVQPILTTNTVTFLPGDRCQNAILLLGGSPPSQESWVSLGLGSASPGGGMGTPSNCLVVVTAPQSISGAGAPDPAFTPQLSQAVNTILPLTNSTLLLGCGLFTGYGETGSVVKIRLDGSTDPSFLPLQAAEGGVNALLLQSNSFLAGGTFSQMNQLDIPTLVRFASDGTVDPGFAPFRDQTSLVGWQAINEIASMPDGGVLCAGSFRFAAPPYQRSVVRITPQGNLDLGFGQDFSTAEVTVLLETPDRGWIAGMAAASAPLLLLTPAGTVSPEFVGGIPRGSAISALTRLPGNLFLAGGARLVAYANPTYTYATVPSLVKIDSEGTLLQDLTERASFSGRPGIDARIAATAVEATGKILVGGAFASVAGFPRSCLVRLFPDGSVDPSLDPGMGALARLEVAAYGTNEIPPDIKVIHPLSSGDWLVGGDFGGFDRLNQPFLVKILSHLASRPATLGLAQSSLTANEHGSSLTVTVIRGGNADEEVTAHLISTNLSARTLPYFETVDTNLVFAPGEWSKDIVISLFDNDLAEPSGLIELRIVSTSTNVTPVGPSQLAVTVADNDINVDFAQPTFLTSEDQGYAQVLVVRRGAAGPALEIPILGGQHPVSVRFAAAKLSFSSVTNRILVPLFDDLAKASNALVSLSLSLPAGVTPGAQPEATVEITDNDYPFMSAQGVAGTIHSLLTAPDGSIYAAGRFVAIHGIARPSLARFHPDGKLDSFYQPPASPDGPVRTMLLQPDHKLVIAGEFSRIGAVTRHQVARLLPDGTLDESFDPGSGAMLSTNRGLVYALGLQSQGKLLIGGTFDSFSGAAKYHLARLETNGAVDLSFTPPFLSASYVTPLRYPFPTTSGTVVQFIRVKSDDRIVLGGYFGFASGTYPYSSILTSLLPDGALDREFHNLSAIRLDSKTSSRLVTAMTLDAQDRILVGTTLSRTWLGGIPQSSLQPPLRRFLPDGTLDSSFQPDSLPPLASGLFSVSSIHLQTNGAILTATRVEPPVPAARATGYTQIARLDPNGGTDSTFVPFQAPDAAVTPYSDAQPFDAVEGTRPSFLPAVESIACNDQLLALAGPLTEVSAQPRRGLAFAFLDGTLQGDFRFHWTPQWEPPVLRLPLQTPWPYVFEVSHDLQTWTPVLTNQTPGTPALWKPPADAIQFYRATKL